MDLKVYQQSTNSMNNIETKCKPINQNKHI